MGFKRIITMAGILVLGSLAAQAGPITIADTGADYSGTQSLKGWTYGYYSGILAPAGFTTSGFQFDGSWDFSTYPPHVVIYGGSNVNLSSPNAGNAFGVLDAVRRWTAPVNEGAVTISGGSAKFGPSAVTGAPSIDALIYINSTLAYSRTIAGNNAVLNPYSFNTVINAGDTIDFVTASHDGLSDANGITFLSGNIATSTTTPEPSTIALFGTALVGLGFVRRRN